MSKIPFFIVLDIKINPDLEEIEPDIYIIIFK